MRILPISRVVTLFLTSVAWSNETVAAQPAFPKVLAPGWKIERVVSEPHLVTPVGCVIDPAGALLVIESHTHFPPDDYPGPATDRIYRLDDSNGDGSLDRQQLFYEGGTATMGLAILPEDWIAVATRSEVFVIRDQDRDGVAEQRHSLLQLQTQASYPHNGLAGIALGPDGNLYIGQGENLGQPYQLIAADGSKQSGGGEGGNIFRLDREGTHLERIATGFWNPFSLHFDSAGRLWTVGNDPDAMPPCRLLNVVEGGDYGFQFRFGRAGTHPLQAWNGELPGTLPMAAAVGEAPCAVVEHRGRLWVTSWGSNRIERYEIQPHGGSVKAKMEIVVQGGPQFRPVGLAAAGDGSIYVTDWVDRSYPVHGKGCLWRLTPIGSGPSDGQPARIAGLSGDEQRARALINDASISMKTRLETLDDDDPFLRHSASIGLVHTEQLDEISRRSDLSPRQRVGLMAGWRWRERCDPVSVSDSQREAWIGSGLADRSPDVAIAAIRWASEGNEREHLPAIKKILRRPGLSPKLFAAAIASIAYLETGTAQSGLRDPACEAMLVDIASDSTRSAAVRSLAIAMLPAAAMSPTTDQLTRWTYEQTDRRFGGEVIRLLVERGTESAVQRLAEIAADPDPDPEVRADAIAGLSQHAGEFSTLLNRSARPNEPEKIRKEARRVLKRVRLQGSIEHPSPDDLPAWESLIGTGGDVQAGRRVFFRTTCANCHAHSGRGSSVGPDLTHLAGQLSRSRLIESILLPSREVAPLFVTWKVLTVDGRVLTGMKLDRGGAGGSVRFLGAEGGIFEVPLGDIETQQPVAPSIMPAGLQQTMSIEEFGDLIAFLENPVW